ncbi:GTP cyclohydrolase I FolE [Formicincola oecophyllae]|uniref:GTP cyclohydrolase 1 n=1 Tax=Formicincola oecophyllae TaxID=2558361 RepID=A0A4Y6U8S5_9PROT|nr:GTP cyclohydrolase I FolE [Formicincola oecophyllae]QDH13400.1 GTP cyclohydrolase I FolE [Formicincola oecophyllae]
MTIANANTGKEGFLNLPDNAEERIAGHVRGILEALGEDPGREGLLETPQRAARMFLDVFSGLYEDPARHLEKQFSSDGHSGLVIVRDIPFRSTCEHHLLPVVGKADVAYLPDGGRLTGLSKLARVVEGYARRPQLQERLTDQVAEAIWRVLHPKAVLVVMRAEHMCMTVRGVKAPGAETVTSRAMGQWADDAAARAEVMALMRAG